MSNVIRTLQILRESISSDEEYLTAVSMGNELRAQALVDEAAKRAGYTTSAGHKSYSKFTVFDRQRIGQHDNGYAGRGFYFAPKPLPGWTYGSEIYRVYLALKNPYHRTQTNWKDSIDPYGWIPKHTEELEKTGLNFTNSRDQSSKDWTEMMLSKGYDGFIDDFGSEIVIFDMEKVEAKIKLADPVTYDDDGDVIPLSKRFNPNSNDIRY